jgi:hypothetical protein
MLRGMTVRQFQEWRAYADLEPFDEARADLRSADIVRTLLNLFGRKKGERQFRPKDCVLQFGGDAPTPQDARAQVLRTMQMLMAIHNTPPKTSARKKGSA